jgi:mannosyltransferase
MTASDRSRDRYERVFIAGLVVGALALRVYRLGDQSLWVDELLTLDVSIPKEGLNIWSYLKYNIHGPLHSFVVYLFQLLGSSDAWLRLPSALAGAAAVLYFYLWIRTWLGHRIAQIAAVMLAVHPLHIYYSQELRNYSFLLFFGMMSCYYFEKMMGRDRLVDRIGYVAAITCAALSNFTAAYLYLVHTVIYLTRAGIRRTVLVRWAAVSLVVLMLLSPWVYRVYKFIDVSDLVTPVRLGQIEQSDRLRGETTITPAALPYALYTYSVGFSLGPSTRELHYDSSMRGVLRNHGPVIAWVVLLFGGVFLRGAWRVIRGRAPSKELFLYLLIPLVVTMLLNWQNAKAFNVRYVLVGYPAYLCFLAIGCVGLRRRFETALLVAVLATLLIATGNLYYNPKYARDDVRGAVRYIEKHIEPGECILAPTVTGVVEHYYRGVEEVHSIYNPPGQPRERVDRQLQRIFAWCNSVWYVRARPWVDDADGYALGRLADRYRDLQVIDFKGVELIHYGPKKGVD